MRKLSLLLLFSLSLLLTSCMLLNPVKRLPIGEISFSEHTQAHSGHVLIFMENSLENKSLKETVWDNDGPFWSTQESESIGYTQNYVFAPMVMPMGASAVVLNKGTRFVIPFGNILSEMFFSGAKKNFKSAEICFDRDCLEKALTSSDSYLIKIKVEEFRLMEKSLNRLNYKAKISGRFRFVT